jgi:hypothetical protein
MNKDGSIPNHQSSPSITPALPDKAPTPPETAPSEIGMQASVASRGRYAAAQPTGEAVQGSRWCRSCRFRSGLWSLHDDRLLRARSCTRRRSHAPLVVPVSLPLLPRYLAAPPGRPCRSTGAELTVTGGRPRGDSRLHPVTPTAERRLTSSSIPPICGSKANKMRRTMAKSSGAGRSMPPEPHATSLIAASV